MRTVYRDDWPYMLKFSLHARVTNSMRVTLPKELRRAVEAKRLAQTSSASSAQPAPHLTVIHDAAYLSVPEHDGFCVLLRENAVDGRRQPAHRRSARTIRSAAASRASLLAEGRGREWFAALPRRR